MEALLTCNLQRAPFQVPCLLAGRSSHPPLSVRVYTSERKVALEIQEGPLGLFWQQRWKKHNMLVCPVTNKGLDLRSSDVSVGR